MMLLVMFVGATNYANSLAFVLTFLLAPMGAVSMWHTQRNLTGLVVEAGRAEPVFAGQPASFRIPVRNRKPTARRSLGLRTRTGEVAHFRVPGSERKLIELQVQTRARGLLNLDRLTVFTRYPIDLFEAWSWIDVGASALVYPKPSGSHHLPEALGAAGFAEARACPGTDDFSTLREYARGDSPKHVAWKASARSEGLLTKRFDGSGGQQLLLSWDATSGPDPEARLSQLALWVLRAEEEGLRYELRLPGVEVEASFGRAHRHRCLEALALWQGSGHD